MNGIGGQRSLRLSVTSKAIGAIFLWRDFINARPGNIQFTDALPKTRSGKIIRRFLRNLASSGEVVGDDDNKRPKCGYE